MTTHLQLHLEHGQYKMVHGHNGDRDTPEFCKFGYSTSLRALLRSFAATL